MLVKFEQHVIIEQFFFLTKNICINLITDLEETKTFLENYNVL